MWFEHSTFAEKTCFVILNFFKIIILILKGKSFHFVLFVSRFLSQKPLFIKSETFLRLSSKIFVKTPNFDSYDVIMT